MTPLETAARWVGVVFLPVAAGTVALFAIHAALTIFYDGAGRTLPGTLASSLAFCLAASWVADNLAPAGKTSVRYVFGSIYALIAAVAITRAILYSFAGREIHETLLVVGMAIGFGGGAFAAFKREDWP